MAKAEVEQETGGAGETALQAELVVGIPGLVDVERVRAVAAQWAGSGHRIAVVYPSGPGMSEALDTLGEGGEVRIVGREISTASSATPPWLGQPVVYQALLAEAESLGASTCVILNPDLAAFTPALVDALARPIREVGGA